MALDGWTYYATVNISNPNSYDLLDFQVLIQLDANNFDFSKAKDDGSDIRFTLSDGETLISHWIEEWDSANQIAKIWVKVPSIPAGGSTTILLWCGNPDAVDASDGSSVFEVFDDFDLNSWELYGTSSTTVDIPETSWIRLHPDDANSNIGIKKSISAQNVVIGVKYNYVAGNGGEIPYIDIDSSLIELPKTNYVSDDIIGTQIYYYETGNVTINDYIGLYATRGGWDIDVRFDWIYVRKYAEKEPSSTVGTLQYANTTIIIATLTTINVSKAVETFTGDGATTTFTVQNKPIIPKVRVWVDGTKLVEGTDFTVDYTNGTITFTTAPASGSTIEILYFYGYIDIVPNATVNITDSAGNTIATATIDAKGDYSVEVPTGVTLYAVADTADFDAKTEFKIE
ncbi:Protein of unknown function DUF2341 [Methanocaldococcus vulcanius M7]|uniref:DUF2341 domain-containing protein n=1 Tax=Methanocaldococcus vulcanius (strain ATCC 700851 / DSM 12094 / M7) TaxID=579137 RepID=C9RFS5_METVM|nr:DUF2341 domain-containing protein [Methanocaldococcus vulcanius]ACX72427.1 Protein of unknown function DUF2341 [Methanocaldococcus vulcanius M7]